MNMMRKDKHAQKLAVEEYFKHWDKKLVKDETPLDRDARRKNYATLTWHYFNLATDLYEYGWRQSFHFSRFTKGELFEQDAGCIVGGPAREIAKFTGCKVVGLNNNDYQIERATSYAQQQGLADQVSFMKGDIMQMRYLDNSFDGVYAIEVTVHAPSLGGIYSEIIRGLKPGGSFGMYEWLMTEKYDNDDPHYRAIRLSIEQGNGISNMEKISVALQAIRKAGFPLELHIDLADIEGGDEIPWYWPLSGELKYMQSIWELPTFIRMTHVGRTVMHRFVGALEAIGMAPKSTQKTADSLATAAD